MDIRHIKREFCSCEYIYEKVLEECKMYKLSEMGKRMLTVYFNTLIVCKCTYIG